MASSFVSPRVHRQLRSRSVYRVKLGKRWGSVETDLMPCGSTPGLAQEVREALAPARDGKHCESIYTSSLFLALLLLPSLLCVVCTDRRSISERTASGTSGTRAATAICTTSLTSSTLQTCPTLTSPPFKRCVIWEDICSEVCPFLQS